MEQFWLLSICTKENGVSNKSAEFHFIGFYRGVKIKKVHIQCHTKIFEKDNTYLVQLKLEFIKSGILHADLIKYKKILI